jgi:type 1 fimbria pilin
MMRNGLIALLVSMALLGMVAPSTAQEVHVRVDGRVQWIAAQTMMLIPGSGGIPIRVDLGPVPLDEYATVRDGDWVVVSGVISSDGRWLIGESVMAAEGSEIQAP